MDIEKEIEIEIEKLYAIGIDILGNTHKIEAKTGRDNLLYVDVNHGTILPWRNSEGYTTNTKLISLEIPEGIQIVHCKDNLIKSLKLPKSVKFIYCSNNELSLLNSHKGIINISCSNNNISRLDVPNSVTTLFCNKNKLKELSINPEESLLKHLECSRNNLIHFKIPKNINFISCDKEVKGLEQYIDSDIKMVLY